jgi:hypothetical protein
VEFRRGDRVAALEGNGGLRVEILTAGVLRAGR